MLHVFTELYHYIADDFTRFLRCFWTVLSILRVTKTQIKNRNMLNLKLRIHFIARVLDQTELIEISEQEGKFKVEIHKKLL